jgi:hypothetical protein
MGCISTTIREETGRGMVSEAQTIIAKANKAKAPRPVYPKPLIGAEMIRTVAAIPTSSARIPLTVVPDFKKTAVLALESKESQP